nr:zinc finger protein 121 isoform X2 [Macaca nemestrina]
MVSAISPLSWWSPPWLWGCRSSGRGQLREAAGSVGPGQEPVKGFLRSSQIGCGPASPRLRNLAIPACFWTCSNSVCLLTGGGGRKVEHIANWSSPRMAS